MSQFLAPSAYPYLTICPSRRPVQKLHTAIGHAKAAVQAQMISHRLGERRPNVTYTKRATHDMEIYEYGETGPELLYSIPAGTLTEDLPWKAKA